MGEEPSPIAAGGEEKERYCRFCKCMLSRSRFSKSTSEKKATTRRRVCINHMRLVYRLKHTVQGGGSIAVEHFRILKNAYQVFARDARRVFGGLKPGLRIQDLATLIPSGQSAWCVPLDPTRGISATNVRVLGDIEQRKTLLKIWESTRDGALYAAALSRFGSLS